MIDYILRVKRGHSTTGAPLRRLILRQSRKTKSNEYIAQIQGVGGKYGLVRKYENLPVYASERSEGSIFEVRLFSGTNESRIYYIVRNKMHIPFLKLGDEAPYVPGSLAHEDPERIAAFKKVSDKRNDSSPSKPSKRKTKGLSYAKWEEKKKSVRKEIRDGQRT